MPMHSPQSLMKCCHEKCTDPSAWLALGLRCNHVLTFSNSPSDSELIWLYKCSQLPRDLDIGTWDISISLTDVILITLNCLTLHCGFTCFSSMDTRTSPKIIPLYTYLWRPSKLWQTVRQRETMLHYLDYKIVFLESKVNYFWLQLRQEIIKVAKIEK